MDLKALALNDNDAMSISAGWATGTGHEEWSRWIDQFRVDAFAPDLQEAIDDMLHRGPNARVTEWETADYGGGSEAGHWLQLSGGDVVLQTTSQYRYYIPAEQIATAPMVEATPIEDTACSRSGPVRYRTPNQGGEQSMKLIQLQPIRYDERTDLINPLEPINPDDMSAEIDAVEDSGYEVLSDSLMGWGAYNSIIRDADGRTYLATIA